MKKIKSIALMLVAILSLSILTGCSSNNESADTAKTRVVKTSKGDVKIPANPKRIVDISGSSEELVILGYTPNLITKPTPIPSNNPPNTVAKSISLVSSGTGLNCSSNTENTNIAYAAFIKKLFPNCLYPKIKKGIFKTKVRILNLTLVI